MDWVNKNLVNKHFKGALCKNWPPVKFIPETNWGQYITRVTLTAANCRKLAQLELTAASSPLMDLDPSWTGSSEYLRIVGVYTDITGASEWLEEEVYRAGNAGREYRTRVG